MAQSPDTIRVLHVDDESDLLELAATFLERMDDSLDVVHATSVTAGLERLSAGQFDCIVSDHDMHEMTGLAFLEAVREEYPDLPFILFTGEGSERVASEAISAGVTDYLQKETGTEQYELLANRIENVVAQHRAEQQARKQERILTILRDLNQSLLDASTRAEIEQVATDILASADPYAAVWIGEYDAEWDRVIPRTVAGIDEASVGPTSLSGATPEDGLVFEAIQADGPAVTRELDPTIDVWTDDNPPPSFEATVVLPITYHGERHGILVLYVERAAAIDATERDMLEEITGDIAQAMQTAQTHRNLRRHRTAVEVFPEGVFVLDDDARIELINENAAALLEATPDDLRGELFPTFVEEGIFGEEIIDWYLDSVRAMLSSSTDQQDAWYETEITLPNGDERVTEIHLTLRPYEDDYRGTVGLVRDITDRTRRERELEENKERYRRLVENAPIPIALYDQEGTLIYVNDTAISFVGAQDRDALLGESAFGFVHPDDRAQARARMTRVLEERKPAPATELSLVDQTGERKEVIITSVPVSYENEPAAQVVIKDITAQKERERALQRQRDQLDEFTSILSHDLRNPLNVATGHLELIRDEYNGDSVDVIAQAHGRMQTLIDDLLTIARGAEPVPDLEAVHLHEVIDECWKTVATAEAELVVDGQCTIRADRGRLKQLLENLIHNAVEHSEEPPTVTIGTLADGFYVEDDGPGIAADERDLVFESGYSTSEHGTGLGLRIVDQIVETHGWDIHLTRGAKGGTRFDVTGVDVVSEPGL